MLRKNSRKQFYSQYPQKKKKLEINTNKEVNWLYNVNYKTLKKEVKEYNKSWEGFTYMWIGRTNIVEMAMYR
jgi:hypothetical protein